MRILISAGGTGGGVYPALAVSGALLELAPETEILWVGGKGGMESELVARAGLPFEAISAAGVHGVGLAQLPANSFQLARGFFEALKTVTRFRPDAAFLTGGYVAVPTALAARARGVPVALYVPDIEPGLALRVLSRLAARIAVTVEDSRMFFGGRTQKRVVVTGYPVRSEVAGRAGTETRPYAGAPGSAGAGERFVAGKVLSGEHKTLLVFGGSRGARSINRALAAALPDLLNDLQIVHISGESEWPEAQAAREALPDLLKAHYFAFPYLHNQEMGEALAAADLVISRAGASTLGEFSLFGLPAILVPYPHAWRYQKVNADYLAAHGAAVRLNDEDLRRELVPLVRGLLNDAPRLSRMREACRALAAPDGARRIAREIVGVSRPARSAA